MSATRGLSVEVSSCLPPVVEAPWDQLVDGMSRPNPFLRSWWLGAHASESARFVLVRDGSELVGGAALALDRDRKVRRCRFLGSGALAPHGLDALASTGRELEVADAVIAWLRDTATLVDLQGTVQDGALAQRAPSNAARFEIDRAPWLPVPASFETYLESRPRKLRQEIRRVRRRLEERDFEYREVEGGDSERALETLLKLHAQRWNEASLLIPDLDTLRRALAVGADRQEVVYQEVLADGEVIVSLVALELGGWSYWYQMGRDPDPKWSNVGTLLKSYAVERSVRRGQTAIDLCVGAAPSKRIWADEDDPVTRVVWAHGPFARPVTRFAGWFARTRG